MGDTELPTAVGSVIRVVKWAGSDMLKNNAFIAMLCSDQEWYFACDGGIGNGYSHTHLARLVERGDMEFVTVVDAGAYELVK